MIQYQIAINTYFTRVRCCCSKPSKMLLLSYLHVIAVDTVVVYVICVVVIIIAFVVTIAPCAVLFVADVLWVPVVDDVDPLFVLLIVGPVIVVVGAVVVWDLLTVVDWAPKCFMESFGEWFLRNSMLIIPFVVFCCEHISMNTSGRQTFPWTQQLLTMHTDLFDKHRLPFMHGSSSEHKPRGAQ